MCLSYFTQSYPTIHRRCMKKSCLPLAVNSSLYNLFFSFKSGATLASASRAAWSENEIKEIVGVYHVSAWMKTIWQFKKI